MMVVLIEFLCCWMIWLCSILSWMLFIVSVMLVVVSWVFLILFWIVLRVSGCWCLMWMFSCRMICLSVLFFMFWRVVGWWCNFVRLWLMLIGIGWCDFRWWRWYWMLWFSWVDWLMEVWLNCGGMDSWLSVLCLSLVVVLMKILLLMIWILVFVCWFMGFWWVCCGIFWFKKRWFLVFRFCGNNVSVGWKVDCSVFLIIGWCWCWLSLVFVSVGI